jgi:tetratricopeptide (TPR) repeat protein
MSEPLSLADHLLRQGRHLSQLGQSALARGCFLRLLALPAVANPLRAEARSALGQIELTSGNYKRARRHFAAAIGLRPYDAAAYYQYALAVEADPDGNCRRGRAALRKAIGINSFEPRYWIALGRVLTRLGDDRAARKAFRRAARLAVDDVVRLGEAVEGLVNLGQYQSAGAALRAARFRAPRDAALRQLWNRFLFDRARRAQIADREPAGAVILSFPDRATQPVPAAATPGIVRVDRASRSTPHVLRLGLRPAR